MFIGRLQEILDLTSRAMALLQLYKLNVGQFTLSVDEIKLSCNKPHRLNTAASFPFLSKNGDAKTITQNSFQNQAYHPKQI